MATSPGLTPAWWGASNIPQSDDGSYLVIYIPGIPCVNYVSPVSIPSSIFHFIVHYRVSIVIVMMLVRPYRGLGSCQLRCMMR